MKQAVYISLLLTLFVLMPDVISAQAKEEQHYTWEISGQLGIQAGGAIPIPMSMISGKDDAVHITLKASPLLSGRISRMLSDKWRIFLELSCAVDGLTADARVTNQRIKDTDPNTDEVMIKYFTGISHIDMSFTYAELPIYTQLSLSSCNKLLMGFYLAYSISSKFENIAERGFIGVNKDEVGAPVNKAIYSDFSDDMKGWDMGFLLGYEYVILSRLSAGVRITFSPIDVFKSTVDYFDFSMHQLRGSISLSYKLFRF